MWKRTGAISASAEPDAVGKALLAVFLGYVAQATILGDVEPASIERGLRDLVGPAVEPSLAPQPRKVRTARAGRI